ncbi:OprO/OprP family phosphate-selective porin [Parabacteroides sp. OttesenSCG-928-G07]|nr:OprO/OprP family phosphate-selective porin [Parabacteroides sp. OttesenSCG-928-G21]MDL2277457.1 OprO/OprP family phosphate-selective porin [Parabacteroides sp. OttesenSCG-928-G07]
MLDTRVDLQADLNSSDLENLTFHGQTIKLWIVGEVVPGVRYRVRQRLNKPQTLQREGYSTATDQAWIALDAGKHFTFTIGKQSVQFGTFEYDYNPADIYQPTMTFDDLDAYKTGLDIAYKVAKQTFHLQFVNSDATQFANYEYRNKAMAALLLWEGDLFNSLLKTRWGVGSFQHSKKKFYNWLTLGTQLNLGHFTTELDYYLGPRNMDYGSVVGVSDLGSRYVRDQSLALNFKYNFGKWRPFLKGTWNQRHDKDFGSNAYESLGIQAVVEFYPFTNQYTKDLRFHAAYAYGNTDFQGEFNNLSSKDTHMILVGTRWLFKAK